MQLGYRRKELAGWLKAVDRHVKQLMGEGRLEKVATGLYMAPRKTRFGSAPRKAEKLVGAFLGDDKFLVVSPNAYNGLGIGTTQLYNTPVVYNRKRHGKFKLDGRSYEFRQRASFPNKLSEEFLLVDLLHNLDRLAEDHAAVRHRALARARRLDPSASRRRWKSISRRGCASCSRQSCPVRVTPLRHEPPA